MTSYLKRPIFHLTHVNRWAESVGARVDLSAQSFMLKVSLGERHVQLEPRLLSRLADGREIYTNDFNRATVFVGWVLPYASGWPAASDKLQFKSTMEQLRLPVPQFWTERDKVTLDFIVKPRRGSFGQALSGPYKTASTDSPTDAEDYYFEQFITGRSAKAWCWNGRVVALEILPRAYLIGDGTRSLKMIATGVRGNMDTSYDLNGAAQMLAWQGFSEDSVPPLGKKVFLDFRYATPYTKPAMEDRDVWQATDDAIKMQFSRAAELLCNAAPEAIKGKVLFTLDAVVDDNDDVWFLEMNSHPMIHPNVYAPMLASLFAETSQALS